MATPKTSTFLPPYLQTTPNRRFLNSTLDLLVNPPQLARFNGYIGRQWNDGKELSGSYLLENSPTRQNYQLEPSFVTYDSSSNVTNTTNFIDLLNSCANKDAITSAWNRLVTGNSYTWKGFTDLDKIVNYQNYCWMNQSTNSWYWNSNIQTNDISSNIIGFENYTTTFGLKLLNGMIISCTDLIGTYIVEGVGKNIVLVAVTDIVTPVFAIDQNNPADYLTINRAAADKNLWSRSNLWVNIDTLNSIINALNISNVTPFQHAKRPIIEFIPMVLFNHGLIGMNSVSIYDAYTPDAISIVQGSASFEIDSHQLIDGDIVIFGGDRNKNVRSSIYTVNFIDSTLTTQIPRLSPVQAISTSNINLNGFQTIDGYVTLLNDRILVNGQTNSAQNGIYVVSDGNWSRSSDFSTTSQIQNTVGVYVLYGVVNNQTYYLYNPVLNPIINSSNITWSTTSNIPLIQLSLRNTAVTNNSVLITNGNVYLDKTVFWNNNVWNTSQNKTSVNQSPLFDVFDLSGNSYSTYAGSNFLGSSLFSYEVGSGTNDPVLGFPISYGPIGNLNDVIFNNNYVTDTFTYTNSGPSKISINNGILHIVNAINYNQDNYIPWQYVNSNLELYQNLIVTKSNIVSFIGSILEKTTPNSQQTQIFVDGKQLSKNQFVISQANGIVTITINNNLVSESSTIFVKVLCPTPIPFAWYDVPTAYQNNPLGQNLESFNMSVIRTHVITTQNNANYSDSGNLQLNTYNGVPGSVLFNESLSLLPNLLLTNSKFDIDQAIRSAADDYVLFKQKLINSFSVIKNAENITVKQAVDEALQSFAYTNSVNQPWFTSDMCAWGGDVRNFTITFPSSVNFSLSQSYVWDQPNTQSLQVYLNNNQLIINVDYVTNGNSLTILTSLKVNDKLSIYEISNTNGSYIPATPTKLGLAAAYLPQIYVDTTYQTPRKVLQGHDGSIVTCFNDYRDNLLLEYELRVFNNLKVNNQLFADAIQTYVPTSNRFRSESQYDDINIYSPSDELTILQRTFFEWAAQYNVDYQNSFYNQNDLFTWNWSGSLDKFSDSQKLLGYWRGNYRWFYDSENVNTRPWEMLNIAVKPSWWDDVYGPSPYTGGNLVMWDDIANGIIRNPNGITKSSYGIKYFGNNSVLSVIPTDASGNLLDPNQAIVGVYDESGASNDFMFGDQGPTETAWRRSSIFSFSKLRSQILQNPLFMCGTLWDTNNYIPSNGFTEFKYNKTALGSVSQVRLNSVDNYGTTQVNGILNYVIEYLRKQNIDPSILRTIIDNTTVNLTYNLGGYSDVNNLSVFANPNNPVDVGSAELIPNQDYSLFLSQSSPVGTLSYSGLIINAIPERGYQISGYNTNNPYFIIYDNISYANTLTIGIAPDLYTYPTAFATSQTVIPYNTIFSDIQSVINFIAGYGEYLTQNGLQFEINDSQAKIDWQSAALQFIKWSLVIWNENQTLSLVLNPASSIINYEASSGTLYDLTDTSCSLLLNSSGNYIDLKYLDVYREKNKVTITNQGGDIFACVSTNIVNYEHKFVIENISKFNDIIYDPITGIRQLRLLISGQKTANWTGTLDCPGFLICTNQVDEWIPNYDYLAGSIVKWKNTNYAASSDIIGAGSFQYNQFTPITTQFTNSILPNLSLKATDYTHAYDTTYRTYITDLVNLRNNTIGYIDRDWLSSLGLDNAAQTDFYRGWIKEKGTLNSLNSYGRGSTPSLNTQVTINEEYAMKVGIYGASARTGFGEVSLPPSVNTKNPLVISFVSTPDSNDTSSIQITPFNLYKKSTNWTNDFVQIYGNVALSSQNFVSSGPIIPQRLIEYSYQNIPNFVKTDESSLFFEDITAMLNSTSQDSILKIAENRGIFWIANNNFTVNQNNWNAITFVPANTEISSITQLAPNIISFGISSDIEVSKNNIIVVDHEDNASNISIRGTFEILDYYVAPNSNNGYANITINLGNISANVANINYSPQWKSISFYTNNSLRASSIGEANIIPNINNCFVENDLNGWAAYELQEPYQNITQYEDVVNQAAVSSIAYDNINNVLCSGKPTGSVSGLVEIYILTSNVEYDRFLVSLYGANYYALEATHPDTILLGTNTITEDSYIFSSATTSSNTGQIYIAELFSNAAPSTTQILSVPNTNYTTNTNFGKSLAVSKDGNWLYVGMDNIDGAGTSGVASYARLVNDNSGVYNTFNITPTSLDISALVNDPYSLLVQVFYDIHANPEILIPVVDYTVSGYTVTFNNSLYNITSNPISVTGLKKYYSYATTIPCPIGQNYNFGASIACNETGSILTVGVTGGSVYGYRRIIENTYYPTAISNITPATNFSKITNVYVNSILLDLTQWYTIQNSNSITIIFYDPLPSGSAVTVEGNSFELFQVMNSPESSAVAFGKTLDLQNNQLLIGSPINTINGVINTGAVYLFELDTQIENQKVIPISSLYLTGTSIRINNWVTPRSGVTAASLVSDINSLTNYSGVIASIIDANLLLTIDSSLNTTGLGNSVNNLTNPFAAINPLFSQFALQKTIYTENPNAYDFGSTVQWISNDLFGVVQNTTLEANIDSTITFTDGTNFDNENTLFSNFSKSYDQQIVIYQLLTTKREWIDNNKDILNTTIVKTIDTTGVNYPYNIFSGDIANLFVIDANNHAKTVKIYNNVNYVHGWTVSTSQEKDIDTSSISAAWIYDSVTNTKLSDLEVVDLYQGILPGSVASNIDYISSVDPAYYNIPNWIPSTYYNINDRVMYGGNLYQSLFAGKSGTIFNTNLWTLISISQIFTSAGQKLWGREQVGMTWFKTTNLKTLDADLGIISERGQNSNQWFPNSTIEVYEWVNSKNSPASYVSNDINGYVKDKNCAYTFDASSNTYGFWVYGKTIPGTVHEVSASQLIGQLSNIPLSGIPMITALDTNAVAVWNINNYISNNTLILHIDYISESGNSQLHDEFALISNNGKKEWMKTPIYSKFVDSLSGVSSLDQLVPDIYIPESQQTGIQNNPVQSLFVDRVEALEIYFTVINQQLANLAVASNAVITALSIYDPLPTVGFDEQIPSRDILNELDITDYPENYKILITADNTLIFNEWSIVSAIAGQWIISEHQKYNLTNNWKYSDWYSSDYVAATPTYEISNFGQISEISYSLGDIIQIDNNGNENKSIYKITSNDIESSILELTPIYVQNGTIQFLSNLYDFKTSEIGFDAAPFDSQYFDNDPYIEIRLITKILNDIILTGSKDLTTAADTAFYAILQYIIHENENLDWLFKTSFITVDYINRNLNIQGPYSPDNQSVIENFINESTPFHTRIREFHDIYTAEDYGNIGAVDFDLPSQYDSNYANIVLNYTDNIKPTALLQVSQFTPNVGVAVNEDSFYIKSNGIPNIIGNVFPNSNVPYSITAQNWTFGVRQSIYSDSIQFDTVSSNYGPIAVAINGIPFFSPNSGETETLYANTSSTISGISGQEIPNGVIDGSNKIFTLAHGIVNPDTLIITLNGVEQISGINYNISGLNNQTITFNLSPLSGASILAYYMYADSLIPGFEGIIPFGIVDGVNTSFTLPSNPSPASSLQLFYNGILLNPYNDFNISGNNITILTFVPSIGSALYGVYRTTNISPEYVFEDAVMPTGAINYNSFVLPSIPNPLNSLQLYYNGMLLKNVVDYNLTNNIIQYNFTIASNSVQLAYYQSSNPFISEKYTINTVWLNQQKGIDSGAGYPNANGAYQYLTDPYLLYTKNSNVHSPLLGYAWDGVPIYGPYGYGTGNDSQSIVQGVVGQEIVTGIINGINKEFTLANGIVNKNTLIITVNGVEQIEGIDYLLYGVSNQNILFAVAPSIGTTILAYYMYSSIILSGFEGVIPTGIINGINTSFSLPNNPTPSSSLQLFYNGLLLEPSVDFTVAGSNISLTFTPVLNSALYAVYRTTGISTAYTFADAIIPSGLINGTNVTFTLPTTPNPLNSLQLYLNGALLQNNIDYTLSFNTITLSFAPSNSVLIAYYQSSVGTGNIILNTSSYTLSNVPRLDKTGQPKINGLQYAVWTEPTGEYIEDFVFVPGLGTLDQNNGRFCITPEYPLGTYAYFTTIVNGIPIYPYIIGPKYYALPYGLKYAYVNNRNTPLYLNGSVSLPKVSIVTANNFIRTPDGSVSSDILTWQEPIYAAWNNNHLSNSELIRQIDTTLRFDRVSKNIETLTQNTSYPINAVVYDTGNSKFIQAIVANANSSLTNNSNVWISANLMSIAESTAMNRIKAEYTPNLNMFANKASLLISGAEYPGVVVSGGHFVDSYPIPTGSLYDQDDGLSGITSLNVSWQPGLISDTALSTEMVRFGNSAALFGFNNDQYLVCNGGSDINQLSINNANFTMEFFMNFNSLEVSASSESFGISSGEIPTGVINGINTVFNLGYIITNPNTLVLTLNGASLQQNVDYSLVGQIITFALPPATGAALYAYYVYEASLSSDYVASVPVGVINGANTTYTLPSVPSPLLSLQLFYNGSFLSQGIDYTIVGNVITCLFAPSVGALYALYRISNVDGFNYSDSVIPAGIVDGVNNIFILPNIPTDLKLFYNGELLKNTVDYTVHQSIITYNFSPIVGSVQTAFYVISPNNIFVMADTRAGDTSSSGLVVYINTSNVCIGSNVTSPIISAINPIDINKWYFITVQGNNSNLSLYIDGELISNTYSPYNFTDASLTLGADIDGNNTCNGFMDEFRLTVNVNRYIPGIINIPIPNAPFPRNSKNDKYFIKDYTVLLFGFDSLNNEAPANINLNSINSEILLNDLSWNTKQLQLINYDINTIVDSSILIDNVMEVSLNQ